MDKHSYIINKLDEIISPFNKIGWETHVPEGLTDSDTEIELAIEIADCFHEMLASFHFPHEPFFDRIDVQTMMLEIGKEITWSEEAADTIIKELHNYVLHYCRVIALYKEPYELAIEEGKPCQI